MRECWINVFASGMIGSPLDYISVMLETLNMNRLFKDKTVYRIHVRMK